MSCAYDKERLTAFFDGELDAAEQAETERHISGCSECLRDLGELKSAVSALKTLPRPRAPRSLAEGVSREIAAAGRIRSIDVWRRRLLWGVAAAASLLILMNVAYFTGERGSTEMAAEQSAAPGIAVLRDKDSAAEARKERAEAPQRESGNAVKKSAPADPQSPFEGKDGALAGGRRSLQEGAAELKKAGEAQDRLRAEAGPGADDKRSRDDAGRKPAAPESPKSAAARPAEEMAKPLSKADAPAAPAAAPPPAPRAEPKPAPTADKEFDEQRRKLTLEKAEADAKPALPPAPSYVVQGEKAGLARQRAEALAKTWAAPAGFAKPQVATGAPPKSAARSFGADNGTPLVLEVTAEQFEELRAELAKAGMTFEPGAPEAVQRGGGGKDAASVGGVAAAEPAKKEVEKAKTDPAAPESAARAPLRRVTLYFIERTSKK